MICSAVCCWSKEKDNTVGTSTNCSTNCGSGRAAREGQDDDEEIMGTSITCSATGRSKRRKKSIALSTICGTGALRICTYGKSSINCSVCRATYTCQPTTSEVLAGPQLGEESSGTSPCGATRTPPPLRPWRLSSGSLERRPQRAPCRTSGATLLPGPSGSPSSRGARMSAACAHAACERHQRVRHGPCPPARVRAEGSAATAEVSSSGQHKKTKVTHEPRRFVVCVVSPCVRSKTPPCVDSKRFPCVDSKRPRVYRHHARMCYHMRAWCRYTRGRFERTHGDVFERTHGEEGRGRGRGGPRQFSAFQNLPTSGYHVLQRFTTRNLCILPIQGSRFLRSFAYLTKLLYSILS